MTDVATTQVRPSAVRILASTAQAFIADQDSEGIVRQCLGAIGIHDAEYVKGNIDTAIAALSEHSSPKLLIVDISGIEDPISRINAMANVCEPNTGVIVVGDRNDITLYRTLKRAGIVDYFFKPLVGDLFARACNNVLTGTVESEQARGGKLVFVLGVRGGVGATTIAVNSAWHLAEKRQRWVMLLDLDLYYGDAALQLGVTPSHALREAFEHPERVDKLFLERAVIPVQRRIDLLSSLEPLNSVTTFDDSAVLSLLNNLSSRYRYIFVDMPAEVAIHFPQILHLPSTCLLVSNGTLVSAREVARWRELIGPDTPDRTTLHILNHGGAPGSLPQAEFTRAAGKAPDVVIPFDRDFGTAAILGIKGTQKSGLLRRGLAPVVRHLSGDPVDVPHSMFSRFFR
ncbi:MAG TPA: cellulose synthase operon protein YhjQ/BcsQ [Pseudolabrys sp.]|nr:cellulose synthase operon protein YhjQ/BcsQ [Pseudolabrys sp.]